MLKNKMIWISSVGLAATLLTACQQSRQLGEMHDTTQKMANTTDGMAKTTDHMDKTTTSLAETTVQTNAKLDKLDAKTSLLNADTEGLCKGSRQALALESREKILSSLSHNAKTPADKLGEAGKYFKAFEFQAWFLCGPIEQAEQDALISSATTEFFKLIDRFVTGSKVPPPIVLNWLDPSAEKDSDFNALAATMSVSNHLQDEYDRTHPGVPLITMYSVFEEALRIGRPVAEGKIAADQLKGYQKDVLINREVAIRLLQARHNFLAAIVLEKTSAQREKDLGNLVNLGIDFIARLMQPKAWKFSLDRFSISQLLEYQRYLKGVIKTRDLLKAVGEEVYVDPQVKALYVGMTPTVSAPGSAAINNARDSFIETLVSVKASQN